MLPVIQLTFGTQVCYDNSNVCMDGYISNGRAYIQLDVLDSNNYVGFGFGQGMVGSDILTFENIGQGQLAVNPRRATQRARPSVITVTDLIVHSTGFGISGRRTANFSRSLAPSPGSSWTNTIVVGANDIVWARGNIASGEIQYHYSNRSPQPGGLVLASIDQQPLATTADVNPVTSPLATTANPVTSPPADQIWSTNTVPTTSTQSLHQNCFSGSAICVSGYVNASRLYVTMDVDNTHDWAGFGIGTGMAMSDIITFEKNGATLSLNARKASAYAVPPIVTNVDLQVISKSTTDTRRTAKFSLPTTPQGSFTMQIMNGKNNVVYALGAITGGAIQVHMKKGTMSGVYLGYQSGYQTDVPMATVEPQGSSASLMDICIPLVGLVAARMI